MITRRIPQAIASAAGCVPIGGPIMLMLALTGCTAADPARPTISPDSIVAVTASVETQPVASHGDAADDPALWVNPVNPAGSLIVGTNKKAGLAVYDLAGRELQFLADGPMNNVDVRRAVRLAGPSGDPSPEPIDVVAAGNRKDKSVYLYRVDPAPDSGSARLVRLPGTIRTSLEECYGLALNLDSASGRLYVFVGDKTGRIEQWHIKIAASGVSGTLVRTIRLGSQPEGIVADDELGLLYLGEEAVGFWQTRTDPATPASAIRLVDSVGPKGRLTADVEGLAIARTDDGRGYLIVSSQGNNAYLVYDRAPANPYVGAFRIADGPTIDAVQETDGIEVFAGALGPQFPDGVFIAQDGENPGSQQNFKLVRWGDVAQALGLPR